MSVMENVLGLGKTDEAIKALFIEFTAIVICIQLNAFCSHDVLHSFIVNWQFFMVVLSV